MSKSGRDADSILAKTGCSNKGINKGLFFVFAFFGRLCLKEEMDMDKMSAITGCSLRKEDVFCIEAIGESVHVQMG